MTNYVIGDVQGCMSALNKLLEAIRFNADKDQLWFAGDLVNRGPESLDVLRFIRSLGDNARCVLGNHDLHLLAVYSGHREPGRKDTLQAILEAPDRRELVDWLRQQPLMFTAYKRSHVICHAGLFPMWTLEDAEREARFVESHLKSDSFQNVFSTMYGNSPVRWKPGRNDHKRLRFAINCFTRMRYCQKDGSLEFEHNGKPGSQPEDLMPWFEVPGRKNTEQTILFGHWSTLANTGNPKIIALDTGCVWGGYLTAFEPKSGNYTQVRCSTTQQPG